MARFTAGVVVDAPVERTWLLLTDWPAHARWVPLTRIRVLTPAARGVGARFVGRSGVGPLAFDDPMEVVRWVEPEGLRPGFCEVVKQGRVVLGGAWFEVAPAPGGRSRVTWTEEIDILSPRLTRPFAPLVSLAGRLAFTATLRAMAAEAAAAGVGPAGDGPAGDGRA